MDAGISLAPVPNATDIVTMPAACWNSEPTVDDVAAFVRTLLAEVPCGVRRGL